MNDIMDYFFQELDLILDGIHLFLAKISFFDQTDFF